MSPYVCRACKGAVLVSMIYVYVVYAFNVLVCIDGLWAPGDDSSECVHAYVRVNACVRMYTY